MLLISARNRLTSFLRQRPPVVAAFVPINRVFDERGRQGGVPLYACKPARVVALFPPIRLAFDGIEMLGTPAFMWDDVAEFVIGDNVMLQKSVRGKC
jgi:hypothetical protein